MAVNAAGKTSIKVKENLGYKVFLVVNFFIMLFVVVVTLYPFLYLVSQSFTSEQAIIRGESGIIPKGFNIETYKYVLKGEFLHYYKNTVIYTLIGTVLSLVFSSLLAYPMAKSEFKINKVLTPFIIFTMYFGGTLISNYILVVGLKLKNTVPAFMTMRRSAFSATSSMLCETRSTVIPCSFLNLEMSLNIHFLPAGSRPATGSSSISILGFIARTPASATLRFSPPDSSNGDW